MRKAFDTNVPKLKPRLRPTMIAASDATPEAQDESKNLPIELSISESSISVPADVSSHESVNASEPASSVTDSVTQANDEYAQPEVSPENHKEIHMNLPDSHETATGNIVQFPDINLRKDNIAENEDVRRDIQTVDTTDGHIQSEECLNGFSIDSQSDMQNTLPHQSTTILAAAPVLPIGDGNARRKRLEDVKRKVAEAVRPEVLIEPVPEDPALAVESVLGLVSDLEIQLSRSRELEKALRIELEQAKAELTRTVNEGRTASGRLGQAEAQLDEKRKVLEEMLFEMSALEEERDQAVRMVQMLTVKDEGRQREFDKLELRYAEVQRTLDENKSEEERLNEELDDCMAENTRLNTLLTQITRERDSLAHNVEKLTKERDELIETKKALEKVHHALSQARARLRE
ncbi:MAG TPA: hypothetical protein VHP36_09135 [Chitinispirillaceae bacterium]|nr:hypothetical protein [Chitinispirillaceae bacterium]